MESWFNRFKNEGGHGVRYKARTEMADASFEYMRLHNRRQATTLSILGYHSLTQFQESWLSTDNARKNW